MTWVLFRSALEILQILAVALLRLLQIAVVGFHCSGLIPGQLLQLPHLGPVFVQVQLGPELNGPPIGGESTCPWAGAAQVMDS